RAKITTASEVHSSKAMRTYREKVRAHAAFRLAEVERISDPVEIGREFRRFIKIEDQRLRIADRCGASGRWIAHARSLVLDVVVANAFRAANASARSEERRVGTECSG